MFKSTCKIIYDPPRPGLKKKVKWWCIAKVDFDIAAYYRWFVEKNVNPKGILAPSWHPHISVIRGEKPSDDLMHLWKKYHGKIIAFEYSNSLKERNGFWFLEPIKCNFIMEIRKELKFPTNWPLHLTVARRIY